MLIKHLQTSTFKGMVDCTQERETKHAKNKYQAIEREFRKENEWKKYAH